MKVHFDGEHKLLVRREPGGKPITGGGWGSADSRLLYQVQQVLRQQGWDLVKKLAYKDGHMVSDHVHYLRTRRPGANAGGKPDIMVIDGRYAIGSSAKEFNEWRAVAYDVHPVEWPEKPKPARVRKPSRQAERKVITVAKSVRDKATGATVCEPWDVEADVYGDFAAHTAPWGRHSNVTHIPTGLAVVTGVNRATARRAADIADRIVQQYGKLPLVKSEKYLGYEVDKKMNPAGRAWRGFKLLGKLHMAAKSVNRANR